MDHHADRALRQSHLRGTGSVVDAIHRLHLEEVVAGTQAADLPESAFDRTVTDRSRIGTVEHAAVFAPLQVPRDAVSLLHREAGATGEYPLQRAPVRQTPYALGADPARYRRIKVVHHCAEPWLQPVPVQFRTHQQTHSARNVESDPAGGDDAAVVNVRCRHATDRKPVSPVHVGHRKGGPDDPGSVATFAT